VATLTQTVPSRVARYRNLPYRPRPGPAPGRNRPRLALDTRPVPADLLALDRPRHLRPAHLRVLQPQRRPWS